MKLDRIMLKLSGEALAGEKKTGLMKLPCLRLPGRSRRYRHLARK